MSSFGHSSVPLSSSFKANMPGMASQQQKKKPAGSQPASASGLKAKKQVILEEEDEEIGDDAEEYENFANVSTSSLETFGLAPHPSPVCEAATLSSVPSPECDYSLKLPAHVLKSGAISALQFQAVRLACARHEQKLPDGSRAGFFLGDGPGVGKGRQIAATIFNYFCRGKTKALWVSVSTDLVVDARRDLEALSMLEYDAVRLHDLRQLKTRKGKPLSSLPGLESGILFCTYDLLCSGATSKKKAGKGAKGATKGKAVSGLGRGSSGGLFADENIPPWERSTSPTEEAWAEDESEFEEFGPQSRLHQIVEWLGDGDYVVVLDECHRAKNCVPRDANKESFPLDMGQEPALKTASTALTNRLNNQGVTKTARAVVELQRRCPDARLMYVSATGASEAENLCYMERLGLWGPGSAFPSKAEFVGLLKQGGIGAMELVAMELKGAGCYLARALSWADVKFETVAIDASPEFVSMYNAAVAVWQDTRQFLVDNGLKTGKWGQANPMSQFYAAQLRFFRQLCTAAKVETVIRLCQEALNDDMCPVIGLQSTGEARTAEYVATLAQAKGADDDEIIFDSFVEPAALILSNFIERNLLGYSGARALLDRAKNLVLPKNPLDDLIDRLGGAANVAEMTGRNKRMERDTASGGYKYVRRTDYYGGCSVDDVNILERAAFQEGRKRVAIISDAASAGISLHADKGAVNTRQRVQITLELAWSADKTVQQLGRTHRSNQLTPPIYKIVSTNICGEHRFASAVAHRLQQLGALTQGDRRAASASEAMAAFNLQTKWAREALRATLNIIITGGYTKDPTFTHLNPPWLEDMMREGLTDTQDLPEVGSVEYTNRRSAALKRWCAAASIELNAVGLEGNRNNVNINTVLNRLLGMRVAMQAQVFGYFSTIMDKVVSKAKRDGTYDATGIIKPGCDKIILRSSQVICEHPNGAASTSHTVFDMDRGVPFTKAQKLLDDELERIRSEQGEAAAERCGAGFYFSDSATTRFFSLALPRNERGMRSARIRGVSFMQANYYRIVRPATGVSHYDVHVSDFRGTYTRINNLAAVEREWTRAYNGGMNYRLQPLNLITGSVLPLLKTITVVLNRHMDRGGRMRRLQLMRVETSGDNLQRFIGVNVQNEIVLRDLLSAIKQLENLTPEQKFRRQQAAQRKETVAGKIAAAVEAFAAKPAAVTGNSPTAAAPAANKTAAPAAAHMSGVDPAAAAGMDPEIQKMLQQLNEAVHTSAALLDASDPAAAAAGSSEAAAADSEQEEDEQPRQAKDNSNADSGSGSSSSDGDDEEPLGRRQARQKRQRRRGGKDRITRADVVAAERAAAAAARKAGGTAAPNVVTEGLAAAGLWEDGSSGLRVRSGGAAAAGGGGTRWQKFAAGSSKAGGSRAAATAAKGRRGRPSSKDWVVSDEEDDEECASAGEESSEDLAAVESSDDDVVAVSSDESSDDDGSNDDTPQQQQPKRQPARRGRGQQQQQKQQSEDELEAEGSDEEVPESPLPSLANWVGKRKRSEDGSSSADKLTAASVSAKASLAAAGVELGSSAEAEVLDEEQQLLERKLRRRNHPAARAQQRKQQQEQDNLKEQQQQPTSEGPVAAQEEQQQAAAAEGSDEDEDFKAVDELPEFRPAKKAKPAKPAKSSAPAAKVASKTKTAEKSASKATADQSEPAAAAAPKPRGRPPKSIRRSVTPKAAASSAPAPAAAPVSVSSRGRIRKPKALPDDYVALDMDMAAVEAAAAAAAAEAEQQQEESESLDTSSDDDDDDEPVLAELFMAARNQKQQQEKEQTPVGAAAAAVAHVSVPEEPNPAQQQPLTGEQAEAARADAADADAQQQQQDKQSAETAAAEPAATADSGTPSQQQPPIETPVADAPVADTPAPAAEPAVAVSNLDLKSKVLSLLPEIAAALSEGETLSVKAVRVAVESSTGWKLTGPLRTLVKDTCQEWVQQQQQDNEAAAATDADEAKLTGVIEGLLKTADTSTVSFKEIRLAAAAQMGLEDLPRGPLRDLAKKLVMDHLLQPTQQQQEEEGDTAAAAALDGQQQQAAAAEGSDDEDFKAVDGLPEFRPCKKAKPAKSDKPAKRRAAAVEDEGYEGTGAAAKSGSSRVAAARSRKFESFNKAAAAGSSDKSSKKRQQQQQQDEVAEEQHSEEQPGPAVTTAADSSKRRRLRHSAAAEATPAAVEEAAGGLQDDLEDIELEDAPPAVAADVGDPSTAAAVTASEPLLADDVVLDNCPMLKEACCAEMMSDLLAFLDDAGAGGRGVSPVPADLFDGTPSPRMVAAAAAAAKDSGDMAAAPPPAVPVAGVGSTESPVAGTAAAADVQEKQQCMQDTIKTASAAVQRPHRRAVIADSDDEDDLQQQQQVQKKMPGSAGVERAVQSAAAAEAAPATATVAAAALEPLCTADGTLVTADFVAALQQQLAAVTTQVAALRQQQQEQQEAAAAAQADADKWKAECQQLKDGLQQLREQQQQGVQAAVLHTAGSAAANDAAAAAADSCEGAVPGSPAFSFEPVAAPPLQQQTVAETPATAATPDAATPMPWGGLSKVGFIATPAAGAAAAEDDPPTPRMGCLAAAAAAMVTSPPPFAGEKFHSGSKQLGAQQQQPEKQQAPTPPLTPGAEPAAAAEQPVSKNVSAVEENNQVTQTTPPTLDDLRSWLQDNCKGATALQILQAFGGSSSSKEVVSVLTGLLQSMVDDLEVIRKGGAAATSSAVDMWDQETLFIPLC